MRIVGKGSDYYDSALGHGFDPNLCYVRKPVTTEDAYDHPLYHKLMSKKSAERDMIYNTNKVRYEHFPSTARRIELKRGNYREINVDPGFIGFCGKVYPFFCVSTERKAYVHHNDKMERTFHYDSDSLIARCKELGFTIQEDGTAKRGSSYWYHSSKLTRRSMDEFLEVIENVDDFFHEIGNPVFAMYAFDNDRQNFEFLENPILKSFQFYKKFDAYTAFQELSMYIGGVLGAAHPPMLEISDKDMAIKKGFGHKYAFRKEPKDMK